MQKKFRDPNKTHQRNLKPMRPQEGALLLEILVSMVIFMVGVLGLIALQARATQISMDGQLRSRAAFFAGQVISEMRLIAPTSLAGNYATGQASYNSWANIVKDPVTGLPGAVNNPPSITISTTTNSNSTTQRAIINLKWQSPGDSSPHQFVTIAEF